MDERGDYERKRSRKDVAEKEITSKTDRISQLPDHIVHHILSFIYIREVTRVCVLSKTWHGFWASFPVSDIDLSESLFGLDSKRSHREDNDLRDREMKFASFVRGFVLRQHDLSTGIQRFRLSLTYELHPEVACLIDHSLQMVTECGVKQLDLELQRNYDLPVAILSAKALTVVRLRFCRLKLNDATINWPALREISLAHVSINKQIIQELNIACPLVEKFALMFCTGFKWMKLSGFAKLKKVKVKVFSRTNRLHYIHFLPSRLQKIEIDVPGLQALHYQGQYSQCQISANTSKNLQKVKLKCRKIVDQVYQDFNSKFHDLKTLLLRGESMLRSINISNQELEYLQLSSGDGIIDAPRLQSFKYRFNETVFPLFIYKSSLKEVIIEIAGNSIDRYFFIILREYLRNFNQIKLLKLCIMSHFVTRPSSDLFYCSSLPAFSDVKHLTLEVNSDFSVFQPDQPTLEKAYEDLLDGVLCMCHPESLLVTSDCNSGMKFTKVLCKNLMHREESNHDSRKPSGVKRWLHDLKGIKIENRLGNRVTEVLTCDQLLEILKSVDLQEKFRFSFQW